MPVIPEHMPPELLQEEIDRLRQAEMKNKKNNGPLMIENVLQVSQSASAKDMSKMVERIDRGMDLALSPEKVQEDRNKDDLLEKDDDDERN